MSLSIEAEKQININIHNICGGVIPEKLYKKFSDQLAIVELAEQMKDQEKTILDTDLNPANVTEEFALRVQAGTYDAPFLSIQSTPPDNLRCLVNETFKLFMIS